MNDPPTSSRDPSPPPAPRRNHPARPVAWPGLPDPARTSLADIRMGDVVEVVEIFFEIVRDHCWTLGLVVGDVCECVATSNAEIVLAHPTAGRVRVERDSARFVLTHPRALAVGIADRSVPDEPREARGARGSSRAARDTQNR